MYFIFSHYMYHGLVTTFVTYIVFFDIYIYIYIYEMTYVFFIFFSHVLFLFYLYTYVSFCIQLVYVSHLMP